MSKAVQSAMDLSREIFSSLDAHWKGAEEGIWRPAYSDEETHGINVISAAASEMGMEAYQDMAGNAYFVYPGRNRNLPVFMTGSHMDAVPKGGRYDGAAGIVSGISAVKMMHDRGIQPERDIVVTAFRGEESAWFEKAYLGSGLACGDIDPSCFDLKRKFTGRTLSAHMQDLGLDPDALKQKIINGECILPVEKIGSFIETHIEQSYTLHEAGMDLGIVTGIRGNTRCPDKISFFGEAAHTGSTPQADRKSAFFGAVYYSVDLDKAFMEIQKNRDIVWDIPEAITVDSSPTTISKQCDVRPEVRSMDLQALISAKFTMRNAALLIAESRGLSLGDNVNNIVISEPAFLDEALAQRISVASTKLGFSANHMCSGAGHDTKILSKHVPTSMIFIAHGNKGLSHNPSEIMAPTPSADPFDLTGSFSKATQVLSAIMSEPVGDIQALDGLSFVEELQERGATPYVA